MSDRSKIISKIKRSIAHIVVIKGDEKISEGTGFNFRPSGEILTAAHTISGGWPIKDGELDEEDRHIIVRFAEQEITAIYRPAVCPIRISFPSLGIEDISIDVGILVPTAPLERPLDFLIASTQPPKIGDDVFLAGYSDEIAFPIGIDRLIPKTISGMNEFRSQYQLGIRTLISGPMIKRGMVGNVIFGSAMIGDKVVAATLILYIDNQMHDGASGGPIVDDFGEARGIIIRRGTTTIDNNEAPAGSTIGIGLDILRTLETTQSRRDRDCSS